MVRKSQLHTKNPLKSSAGSSVTLLIRHVSCYRAALINRMKNNACLRKLGYTWNRFYKLLRSFNRMLIIISQSWTSREPFSSSVRILFPCQKWTNFFQLRTHLLNTVNKKCQTPELILWNQTSDIFDQTIHPVVSGNSQIWIPLLPLDALCPTEIPQLAVSNNVFWFSTISLIQNTCFN